MIVFNEEGEAVTELACLRAPAGAISFRRLILIKSERRLKGRWTWNWMSR
jgi:hypothetical protein